MIAFGLVDAVLIIGGPSFLGVAHFSRSRRWGRRSRRARACLTLSMPLRD
jgi:hypothetical protein